MQCTPSGVDGCNACWCQYYVLLLGVFTGITQEGGLARTCLARQENGLTGVLDEIQCILKLFIVGVGRKAQGIGKD